MLCYLSQCLSVRPSVPEQDNSESGGRISNTFSGLTATKGHGEID